MGEATSALAFTINAIRERAPNEIDGRVVEEGVLLLARDSHERVESRIIFAKKVMKALQIHGC